MDQKDDKFENENIKMKNQQINEQEKIIKTGEFNIKMGQKRKMANIESNSGKKHPKSTIRRRPIPAELMNELFGSLPFENAFAHLAKMPNGLLARNVRKMIESIKMAIKENKWNSNDRGPGLDIGEDRLVATSNGTKDDSLVRAKMPIFKFPMQTITKPLIAYYFEVQILNCSDRWFFGNGILIGYCGLQFPLEQEWLGRKNSIGIWQKRGIRIDGKINFFEDDYEYEEGRYANEIWEKDEVDEGDEEQEDMERYIDPFEDGDVIGVGIIQNPNSSLECFATCNGELMGKAELPAKFVDIQLFPAINLFDADNSVRTNFGEEEWEFKEFGDPRPSSIKGEVTMTRMRN